MVGSLAWLTLGQVLGTTLVSDDGVASWALVDEAEPQAVVDRISRTIGINSDKRVLVIFMSGFSS